jgi:hypothetical protein
VLAQTLIHAERLLTVARGLHLATAVESALKIAETTSSPTQSFSSADLAAWTDRFRRRPHSLPSLFPGADRSGHG